MAWSLLREGLMRIAIAHWQGRISPVFDVSDRLLLIDIADGREHRREDRCLSARDPFERAKEVAGLGAGAVLCGAVSHELEAALLGLGVQVVGFIRGGLEAVIAAFIAGQLTDSRFRMPGCRRKQKDQAPRRVRRHRTPSPKAQERSVL